MKLVKFHLYNIQSHENTTFTLNPGLNFILADDNNVGKSTIFKAIMMMAKMPRVNDGDFQELLRGQTDIGHISLEFDNKRVTFWLNREGPRVRAFFEIVEDGVSTRSATCPQSVLDALDIVLGSDGLPINFNDADSVQLIVQDTAKNDEVLSKVLIDATVDIIKANAVSLDKQVQQDYRVVSGRHTDTNALLSQMHYNDAVDAFLAEKEELYALVRVTDCLAEGCELKYSCGSMKQLEPELLAAINVLDALPGIVVSEACHLEDFEVFESASTVVGTLGTINCDALLRVDDVDLDFKLDNVLRVLDVIENLRKAEISCKICATSTTTMQSMAKELSHLEEYMRTNYKIVQCPVKGEVYYSGTECVPTHD